MKIRVGLDKNLFPPRCRAWLDRQTPIQAENMVKLSTSGAPVEVERMISAMEGAMMQLRFRIYCEKFDGHSGKHKFQTAYNLYAGRKKVERENGSGT